MDGWKEGGRTREELQTLAALQIARSLLDVIVDDRLGRGGRAGVAGER